MCLAVPAKIVALNSGAATIDVYGAQREVSVMLLPDEPRVGDYVLVHAGFAIQKIDKETVASGVVMHEASIALSILDIVTASCEEQRCSSVDSVTVQIGKAAGIMPEALVFAFDAAKTSTPAKNANLIVQTIPVGGTCKDCSRQFESQDAQYVFSCPLCGSSAFELTQGREMDIVEMEMS